MVTLLLEKFPSEATALHILACDYGKVADPGSSFFYRLLRNQLTGP